VGAWVEARRLFHSFCFRASAVQHREMQCQHVMALTQRRAGAQLMSKVAPVMTRRRRPVQAASAACAACQRTRRQREMHRLCRPGARRTSSPRTTEFSRRSSRRCLHYCAASLILPRHGALQSCARAGSSGSVFASPEVLLHMNTRHHFWSLDAMHMTLWPCACTIHGADPQTPLSSRPHMLPRSLGTV